MLLLCLPFEKKGSVGSDIFYPERFPEQMKCLIMLDNSIFSNHTREIGFNYDLLGIFGEENGRDVRIESKNRTVDCWRMLSEGGYDVMVFNSTDTVPAEFADSVLISIPVRNENLWAVSSGNAWMMNYINLFINKIRDNGTYRNLVYRHFKSYCIDPVIDSNMRVGALSPYDDFVKKYASQHDLDWRLISAIIYQESRYNMAITSSNNAKGLMQILESTAATFGVNDVLDPELNIKAGTLYFSSLLKEYRSYGMDESNAVKFALGAYNAGGGRISECRKMADSLGLDNLVWEEVAAAFDSVKTFSGRKQTKSYVVSVLSRYEDYRRMPNLI